LLEADRSGQHQAPPRHGRACRIGPLPATGPRPAENVLIVVRRTCGVPRAWRPGDLIRNVVADVTW
jgi:hypothetical protein